MDKLYLKDLISNFFHSRNINNNEINVYGKEVSFGLCVISLFIITVLIWSSIVPLSSAAIAPAVVSVDGYKKVVQHLEGGIIKKILVKDGDIVLPGRPLIEMDDIQIRADYDLWYKKKVRETAKEARLLAEYHDKDIIDFPDWMTQNQEDQEVRNAIQSQIDTFNVIHNSFHAQIEVLNQSIIDANNKVSELHGQSKALDKQKSLVHSELKKFRILVKKGLVTRAQVFNLEEQEAKLDVDISSTLIAIASVKQEINKLQMEVNELKTSRAKATINELNLVREELVKLEQEMAKAKDKLERSVIKAPIEGVVVNRQVHTLGGVISSGQPLLDIVPANSNLIVEARVDPRDRDTVQVGQTAEVRFTAFNQRVTAPVKAHVILISADRLMDEVNKTPYYQAKIELLEDPQEILGAAVYPGMQAEVMITTGSRTAIGYIFAPITQSFNRAFKEE